MRLNEILTESQELEEGPLDAIGRGVAKGLGGIAKGAGMVAGVGTGMKKAYQKGKATSAAHIAGDVPAEPEDPEMKKAYDDEYAKVTAPKQAKAAPQQAPAGKSDSPFAGAVTNPAAPQGGNVAAAPAPQQAAQGQQAAPAPQQTPAAAPQQAAASGTAYKQAQQAVAGLDKKGKQRIMAMLQKQVGGAPAAAPAAKAEPQVFSHSKDQGLGKQSDGQFIQPNQQFDTATGAPLAKPAAKPARAKKQAAAPAVWKNNRNPSAPATTKPGMQTQSKVTHGNIIAEGFTFYRKK